jgi:hypothetical protein
LNISCSSLLMQMPEPSIYEESIQKTHPDEMHAEHGVGDHGHVEAP